jgi:hypothetical protein
MLHTFVKLQLRDSKVARCNKSAMLLSVSTLLRKDIRRFVYIYWVMNSKTCHNQIAVCIGELHYEYIMCTSYFSWRSVGILVRVEWMLGDVWRRNSDTEPDMRRNRPLPRHTHHVLSWTLSHARNLQQHIMWVRYIIYKSLCGFKIVLSLNSTIFCSAHDIYSDTFCAHVPSYITCTPCDIRVVWIQLKYHNTHWCCLHSTGTWYRLCVWVPVY